jgi:hypothetical protein
MLPLTLLAVGDAIAGAADDVNCVMSMKAILLFTATGALVIRKVALVTVTMAECRSNGWS